VDAREGTPRRATLARGPVKRCGACREDGEDLHPANSVAAFRLEKTEFLRKIDAIRRPARHFQKEDVGFGPTEKEV
jgi:hypothetical protein